MYTLSLQKLSVSNQGTTIPLVLSPRQVKQKIHYRYPPVLHAKLLVKVKGRVEILKPVFYFLSPPYP